MRLLTFNEFKNIADFSEGSNDDRFNKALNIAEQIYLPDLIGAGMVAKIKAGNYAELVELVKYCLAKELERYFIETANTKVDNRGLSERTGDFSRTAEMKDKQLKIDNTIQVLKRFESRLISTIIEGEYAEYNENEKTSKTTGFTITSVG